MFTKSTVNDNGKYLIDFLTQNRFLATHRFFNHKLTNISTQESLYFPEHRRNPYRNQIDFILAHISWKRNNNGSKAIKNYGTFRDYKPVVARSKVNWVVFYSKPQIKKKTRIYPLVTQEANILSQKYSEGIQHDLHKINRETNQLLWKNKCIKI